jgi:predicted O-linked N-acetylglucosamine transferase (SPINDLY family)
MQSFGHAWREIAGMPDDRVAELIMEDGVDVLVDLTGHTADHKLLVLARRPAPVQVTYLGYPATTGMSVVDYKVTDATHDPPGVSEGHYSEKLARLPECAWCFRPDDDFGDVGPPPFVRSGHVTFGSLHRPIKVNPRMVDLWARVLHAVPRSRLVLLANPGGVGGAEMSAQFAARGIPSDRIELVPRQGRKAFLSLYNRIDVLLDAFPYNGQTTVCDSLWMGVPPVTLCGAAHVARTTMGILSTVGLPDLAATTDEEYFRTATDLARDGDRLIGLRRTLRDMMAASSLRDEINHTRRLEAAYDAMWATWCRGGG